MAFEDYCLNHAYFLSQGAAKPTLAMPLMTMQSVFSIIPECNITGIVNVLTLERKGTEFTSTTYWFVTVFSLLGIESGNRSVQCRLTQVNRNCRLRDSVTNDRQVPNEWFPRSMLWWLKGLGWTVRLDDGIQSWLCHLIFAVWPWVSYQNFCF